MAKIEDIISSLDAQITELEARNHINVTMRVDETIALLKVNKDIATDAKEDQKFDLVVDASHCTFVFKVGSTTISAGSNVLSYGDTLKITATADTGYDITSLKVNGTTFVSGSTISVTDNILIEATTALKTFDLTQTVGENCSLSCTVGGESVSAGTGVLTYGDVLTITASASEGYTVSTLTVNGETFTSGNTLTVSSNVAIVVEATETPAPETTQGE